MPQRERIMFVKGFPAGAADVGLLLLRVFTGLALALAHGWDKVPPSARFISRVGEMGLPAPELFAWLAALAEFGGGVLLALGLFTGPVAMYVVAHFTVVVAVAHSGDTFAQREKAILFGMIALMYALVGPGRYSLDALLSRRRPVHEIH
jgi:putative oxidoreductase